MAKQTGPKTREGKQISSGNSVTNGCRSKQHRILKNERAEDYDVLRARWLGEYGASDKVDEEMLERVVQAEWRMRRCERQLAEVEEFLGAKSLMKWTEEDHKLMVRARRYYSEAIRFYHMARRDLDNMRMTREREIAAVYRAQCSLRDMPWPAKDSEEEGGAETPSEKNLEKDATTEAQRKMLPLRKGRRE